jgi:hypothetical protein
MPNDTTITETAPATATHADLDRAAEGIANSSRESDTQSDAELGAIVESKTAHEEAVEHLITDVRSFYAAKDATAIAIAADLKHPESSPQPVDGQDDRNRVIHEYRETISDLLVIRRELDDAQAFTQPLEGEHVQLWTDYADRIYQAHALRKAL